MKFTGAISLFATAASALTVSYDTGYDDASRSLSVVSCSDGANGLTTRYGWTTQGQVPGFPKIGGSVDIAGWNSAQCGQCYKVTYNGQSINIIAIDHSGAGLNLSKAALNTLTKGQAEAVGRIEATVEKVGVDQCGLTPSKRTIEFNA